MAAPYPPAGHQSSHTERPLKIYAEQYLEGQLPVGAVIDPGDPPLFQDGQARVPLPTGWVVVNLTDWVISNRYTGKPQEVISADECAERFGPGGNEVFDN
jgi:hypothetical protein